MVGKGTKALVQCSPPDELWASEKSGGAKSAGVGIDSNQLCMPPLRPYGATDNMRVEVLGVEAAAERRGFRDSSASNDKLFCLGRSRHKAVRRRKLRRAMAWRGGRSLYQSLVSGVRRTEPLVGGSGGVSLPQAVWFVSAASPLSR